MWVLMLKALRTMRLFQYVIIVNRAGKLAINRKEGVKLVATVVYFKYEASLREAICTPQQILASVRGDASAYAGVIRRIL